KRNNRGRELFKQGGLGLDCRFGLFAGSNIVVGRKQANYASRLVVERVFVGFKPLARAVVVLNRFIDIVGHLRRENVVFFLAKDLGLAGLPRQVVIGLARNTLGRSKADVYGKTEVAAKVVQLRIFPVNSIG